MANSDVPPPNEKQTEEMGKSSTPPSNKEQVIVSDNNLPSAIEKQKVEIGNNSTPSLNQEQVEVASSNVTSASETLKIIGTATSDMEYRVELFNRLTHTCFSKCVDKRFKDGELNIGENTCIDRCVSKYYQVNSIIGHILASGVSRRNAL